VAFPGYVTKNKKTQSIPIGEDVMAVLSRAKVLQVGESLPLVYLLIWRVVDGICFSSQV
jgi:hypothetical protein